MLSGLPATVVEQESLVAVERVLLLVVDRRRQRTHLCVSVWQTLALPVKVHGVGVDSACAKGAIAIAAAPPAAISNGATKFRILMCLSFLVASSSV